MALDYKLHKATEKKIDELVDQKTDIKRREDNLIAKIEELQKDNKRLIEEQKEWDLRKSLEFRQLRESEKKARGIQQDAQNTLDDVSESLKTIEREKKALQDENKRIIKQNKLTKSILRRVKKERRILRLQESKVKREKAEIAGLKLITKKTFESADGLLKVAEERTKEAEKIYNRAVEKDKEVNSLKIKLGIRAKALDLKEKEIIKQRNLNKARRQENEMVARELKIKRQLLTKAYTQADIEDLDTKVERMITSEKK